MEKKAKVLVCQRGARHRFAVPRLLHEAGLLSALYTDSCRLSPMGRVASALVGIGLRPRFLSALAARRPEGIPASRVRSSDAELWPRWFGGGSLAAAYRKWGLGGANVVYSMYGEDPDFLEWAKAQGARIMVDVFVHPGSNRIVAHEEERFLGASDTSGIGREDRHSERVFKLADLLLCPSGWVAEGVREFAPECGAKVRVVPYGSSVVAGMRPDRPRNGIVLFAGREPLRKGLHYLAEAAHLLRAQGRKLDVHVAGVAQEAVGWMEHGGELNCLGSVPMAGMKEEYAKADVFVLPSLTEGQAGVLLESMACGVPVVATRESGVDFEPGCGVTIPVGNAEALAEAIRGILDNSSLGNRLSEGAIRQSARFSMEAWKQRLVDAVGELVP